MAVTANRKTVMALVREATAGTPVSPTGGVQFVALQEGFSMSPGQETTPNNELTPTIDTKADIVIRENPTSSVGHYFRHSGVEATAPNYDILIESALGSKVAAIAETSVSGAVSGNVSTQATITLNASGNLFDRGYAVLAKSSSGYFVRNVQSVSGQVLTMAHNLPHAPAQNTALGRPIHYKPNDELPSLSQWLYRANGGAIELMGGSRVSSMEITAEAGQPLNMAFELGGTSYSFDPIEIVASNRYLDFNIGGSELSAVVPLAMYKSPHELAEALEAAMLLAGGTGVTVVYNDTGSNKGKFTIAKASGTLNLLFASGTNNANSIDTTLGFSVDLSASLTYTSATEQSWAAAFSRTDDSNVNPLIVKYNEVLFGTFDRTVCSQVQSFTATLTNELQDVPDICAESGIGEKRSISRSTEVAIVMSLAKHDADVYEKFRTGDIVKFAFNGGVRVGGNFVAGRVVNFFMPEAKVTAFEVSDQDDVVVINATLSSEANSQGLGSVYVNLL